MAEFTTPPIPIAAQAQRALTDVRSVVGAVTSREAAEKVAQEFERMFVSEMLQPMFKGISSDGPFGGGSAEDTFRPMLLDQYADAVAKGGGVGIADAVLKEILRLQGLE